ncbi:apolipoprotein N-acyltransferase [Bogoriella caseilytica]|uniref:Apolipoprotein N-acyltransferase n=1 Tax=Bogoriella caseilytica TaxID=56055 RepID=A0A3N2BGL5_9MICO|nr:apolipoprotein N-acyltransferase [Bogoriella caseilytica]ROR74406.1 apolipoprotein N-acyltransferase [Bogoriella caseilytica]
MPAASPRGPRAPGRVLSLVLALLGGVVTEAAFPDRSWWPLAYVGVALLVLALRRDSVPWGYLLAFAFGLTFFLPHVWWATESVGEPIGWIALSIAQAAMMGLFGAAAVLAGRIRMVREQPWLHVLVLAVLWVAVEALRGRWPFGGLPWGALAFSQTEAPLLRLASVGSTPVVSAAVVIAGAALAMTVVSIRRLRFGGATVLLLLAAGVVFGPWLVPLPSQAETGSLRLAAIQGNVPRERGAVWSDAGEVTGNHLAGTEDLVARVDEGAIDVVLWPESSADIDPRTDPEIAAMVEQAAQAVGAPMLLGTQSFLDHPDIPGQRARYNEIILWEAGTGPVEGAVYAKQRPVPFGEYMPYRDFFRMFTEQVDRVVVDMLPGDGPAMMPVPIERLEREVRFGVAICFEVAYDGVVREGVQTGGELIIVPTNNSSFGDTDLSDQQLAMSRFRAVEHGRAVVQISTMGLSAVVTPNGVYQSRTGHWTAEQMLETVPLRTSHTLATTLGAAPVAAFAGVAVLVVVAGAAQTVSDRRARRRRPGAK